MKHYDIIVIGSGGGTKLVRPVADLGKKVALAEMESPGGTCLNRGCIPSKMLIYPADLIHLTKNLDRFQIKKTGEWEVDFPSLIDRISKTVDDESLSIPPVYENHPNIDYFPTKARFVGEKEIQVNDEIITGEHIVIAVGGRPQIPNIEGLSETPYWTSREALRAKQLPKRMIVYGGGYIGLELGMAYAGFGTDVTFVVRSQVLREEDHDIRDGFQEALQKKANLHSGVTLHRVSHKDGIFTVELSDAKRTVLSADALLIATGLIPNTDDLGLENTKIKLDPNGFIQTNDYLETSVSGIYAIGDAIGRYFFRHSVNFEGEYLFQNIYRNKNPIPIHYPPMPHAVFTYPEVASVGLTEEACRTAGFDYIKAIHPYSGSAMGMARLPEEGFVKIIMDCNSKKILGAHIMGDEASNMIHMLILGMSAGCTIDDYLQMIYIHPALPEIIRNAFRKLKQEMESK